MFCFANSAVGKRQIDVGVSKMEITSLKHMVCRAQKDFQEALKHPGTDPELINRHATRFRLITATLANRMNELITLLGEGHEKDG